MNTDNTIILSDGRTLGYAEYGDKNGFPVLYFHGGQESRLSSIFMDSVAMQLGIRIIAPDRPGIGLSSFQQNRRFTDWKKDVLELVNHLGISKYSVLGLSGGAPHVLACLYEHSNSIVKASIVSGATPCSYKGSLKGMWFPVKLMHFFASRKSDKTLRKYIQKDANSLYTNPDKRVKQFQNYLPKPDRELMKNQPEYGRSFITGSVESYKQGIDGVVQEWQLYVTDWGLNIEKITKHITLWYGDKDKMAPTTRGEYYHKTLPSSTLNIIHNEAHFSLIRNHLAEILNDLKEK